MAMPTTCFFGPQVAQPVLKEKRATGLSAFDAMEIQKRKEEKMEEEKRHEEEMRKLREQEKLLIEKPKAINFTFGFGSLGKKTEDSKEQKEEEKPEQNATKNLAQVNNKEESQPVFVSFQRAKQMEAEVSRKEPRREFKKVCGVCRKGFFDDGMLQLHERVSNLHKENLLKQQNAPSKRVHFLFKVA